VPQSVLYDNDRCLVACILPDGTRNRARLFSGFLSHYVIHDRYGRPGKGNDKGSVEGLVGWARRNFMVPVPRFASWEDFNVWLEEQCRKRHADILRGHTETIGQRLQRDLEAMAELPPAPSDIVHAVPELIRGMSVTIGPAMPPLRLGVNIDHVATIRNARGGQYPDPVRAAKLASAAGADSITAHLREDRRHIRHDDIARLKAEISKPIN
jgi:hypothetical protein